MVDTVGRHDSFRHAAARPVAARAAETVHVCELTPAWIEAYEAWCKGKPLGTAQHPAWLRAWSAHAAPDILAITVESAGAPVLMLPLEAARQGWSTVARFIGASHANGNFPAVDRRWAAGASAVDIGRILRELHRARPDIDLVLFERMVAEEEGTRNPLAALGGARSPNIALSADLHGGFEAFLKRLSDRKAKKHRAQLRRFEEAGGFQRIEARSGPEVDRLLEAFFTFKEQRFRAAGIPNVFAAPKIRAAFRALFAGEVGEADPAFVLHGLEVGGKVRAVTGQSRGLNRTTCEFGAIGEDEIAKHSPGEFLFYLNIEETATRGDGIYDFGVGDEVYKRQWCDVETEHTDVAVALSAKGHAMTGAAALARRAKIAVKRNPALWQAVKRWRRTLAGADAAPAADN